MMMRAANTIYIPRVTASAVDRTAIAGSAMGIEDPVKETRKDAGDAAGRIILVPVHHPGAPDFCAHRD
jgi:hypothetical protein